MERNCQQIQGKRAKGPCFLRGLQGRVKVTEQWLGFQVQDGKNEAARKCRWFAALCSPLDALQDALPLNAQPVQLSNHPSSGALADSPTVATRKPASEMHGGFDSANRAAAYGLSKRTL
jgi:hypothetical protein